MSAQLISLWAHTPRQRDWTSQEIAQFYRVEAALVQAGIRIETDRGLTDEGDPWFVFCRAEDGEVIAHFARTSGEYVIAAAVFDRVVCGKDFGLLVRDLLEQFPVCVPSGGRGRSNVVLHPSALLVALIASAVFKMGEARAATREDVHDQKDRLAPINSGLQVIAASPAIYQAINLDAGQASALLAAVVYAVTAEKADHAPEGWVHTPGGHLEASPSGIHPHADLSLGQSVSMAAVHSSPPSGAMVAASQVVALVDSILAHTPAPESLTVASTAAVSPQAAGGDPGIANSMAQLSSVPVEKVPNQEAAAGHANAPTLVPPDHSAAASTATDLVLHDIAKIVSSPDGHVVTTATTIPDQLAAVLARETPIPASLTTPPAEAGNSPPQAPAQNLSGPSAQSNPPPASSDVQKTTSTTSDSVVFSDPHQAEQVVLDFMNHVQHLGYAHDGELVVLYDQDDVQQHSGDLTSLSFHFADGSTISLVGTHLSSSGWI